MEKIITVFSAILLCLSLTACGSGEPASAPSVAERDKSIVQEMLNEQDSKTDETKADDKQSDDSAVTTQADTEAPADSDGTNVHVAYFSRADENYSVGTVEVGNTQILAEYIADEVGADSFHIETVNAYPADYDDCCDVAKQELADKARPEIQGSVENMEQYDIIFLGYPIWWGDMPMAVYTFMDSYELSDKVIIPFCTHEGSSLSGTDSTIADYTGAQVLTAIDMRGSTAQELNDDTKQTVRDWLDGLGF